MVRIQASALPRAASWDRNLATTINAYFDATGRLFGTDNIASSSGKLFVSDLTPRTTDEWLAGTARTIGNLSLRVYWRYKHSTHFWEDTNNTARTAFRTTGLGAPDSVRTVWKPNLSTQVNEEHATSIMKLIAALEDDDDVQAVFTNFEVDEAVMAKLTAA